MCPTLIHNNSAMTSKGSAAVLSLLLLFQSIISQSPFRKDYFRSPLDIGLTLSGNFGELRTNHFHAGIDIKTRGVTGHKVYAAADGYISRIKIEAAGYGNTLYITHPAGYTTVYAHLGRFREDIAGYVRDKQYRRQQHSVNIYPGKEEWQVKKGELVAFSGTSGYSFGPHLHFEIRDASRQEPLNTLRFGLDIEDLVAPKIFSLFIYPDTGYRSAGHPCLKTSLDVQGGKGNYRLKNGDTIPLEGAVGFGLEAFDYLNGAHNRCGIYRIRMQVDDELDYEWTMDRFRFSQARYINSYIDYEEKMRNGRLVQKAFVEPGNELGLYHSVVNNGKVDFSRPGFYRVCFVLDDAYENRAELNFTVQGGTPGLLSPAELDTLPYSLFPCALDNEFRREDIVFSLPAGALYTDLKFRYRKEGSRNGSFSPMHVLHNPYTPIHSPCTLSIRPSGLPEDLREKALIAFLDEEEGTGSAGGEWDQGMITTQIREFGTYFVLVDTLAPEIRSLDLPGSEIAEDPEKSAGFIRQENDSPQVSSESLRFIVKDALSGIKSYEGYIDNEWVLFEYDAKNDLVFYRFDPGRLESGKDHELELYIVDNKENIAYYYAVFHW